MRIQLRPLGILSSTIHLDGHYIENKVTNIVSLQLQLYYTLFDNDRLKNNPTLDKSIPYCVWLILRVEHIDNALARSMAVSIRVPQACFQFKVVI